MGTKILLFLVGVMMITVSLMRHARRKAKKREQMEQLKKVRVRNPEKDREFGKAVKWSIGDDD